MAESAKAIVTEAAQKYGIRPDVLWGLYGTETSFGKDVSTSSAGAVGPFQFEPGTAKSLGINPYNFKQAAFGAAKYLSEFRSRGTAGMLSAYNAGPNGGLQSDYVAKTLANAKSYGGGNPGAAATAAKAASSLPIAKGANTPVAPSTTTQLDLPALQAANRPVALDRILLPQTGGADNPLRLVMPTKTPNAADFMKTVTTPGVAASGGTPAGPLTPGVSAGGVGSAPINPLAPPAVKTGGNAPPPLVAGKGAAAPRTLGPVIERAKVALERASGHPVSLPELEKEVAAGGHGHYAQLVAPTNGRVVGSYNTPSGRRAIVHHANGKIEHVASTLPVGHKYVGGEVLGAPLKGGL
jgi:hypothetical protein